MSQDYNLFFSHFEHIWKAELKDRRPDFKINGDIEKWTWDNCFVSAHKISEGTIRVIVRSQDRVRIRAGENKNEESTVLFSYNFDTSSVTKPEIEENFVIPHNPVQKTQSKSGTRRVLKLSRDNEKNSEKKECEIWEWISESNDSKIEKIYQLLENEMKKPIVSGMPIIEEQQNQLPKIDKTKSEIFPIIYQPAIDTHKNFLRQVHIHKKNENVFEVTLVFNNEELRKNRILNNFYEDFRKVIYGRIKDVESFNIVLEQAEAKKFVFEGIYSEDKTIKSDTTHGDKRSWFHFWGVPKRPIKFYYTTSRFPKVYVNTSNHAMAGHDNNRNLWKWEYVTWGDSLPIGVGTKSRKSIETELTNS